MVMGLYRGIGRGACLAFFGYRPGDEEGSFQWLMGDYGDNVEKICEKQSTCGRSDGKADAGDDGRKATAETGGKWWHLREIGGGRPTPVMMERKATAEAGRGGEESADEVGVRQASEGFGKKKRW
ncbi:hypothetical protein COCNU_scaffold007514G000120 [Cocos nucifera]|nr:hypothetical protein [Cocos nucifera]